MRNGALPVNRPTLKRRAQKSDPMREVVGFQVGTIIYPEYRPGGVPITRAVMQFMAACDLGQKWHDWAKAPTLATLSKSRA